jgi:hypothetical protein
MNPDAWSQFEQATSGRYTDWHPPIVAQLWSLLLPYFDGGSGIFLIQQVFYWFAVLLLVQTIAEQFGRRNSFLLLAVAIFPYFLYRNQLIIKDTFMATALLLAVAFAFRREFALSAASRFAYGLGFGLMLMIGMLARTNGVFAAGPLLLLMLPKPYRSGLGILKILAFSAIFSVLFFLISGQINYNLLKAERSDPMQSLQLFDIFGTAVLSNNPKVLAGYDISIDEARKCYTPYNWDSLAPYGDCSGMREALGFNSSAIDSGLTQGERKSRWLNAVMNNPIAYVKHRIYHYNSSLYFIVPVFHDRYGLHTQKPIDLKERSTFEISRQYLTRGLLISPIVWIAFGVSFLYFCFSTGRFMDELFFPKIVVTSALMYGAAYLFIGVATDVRYYYWTMMAIAFSIALAAARSSIHWHTNRSRINHIGTVIFLLVLLGYSSRVFDVRLPGLPQLAT